MDKHHKKGTDESIVKNISEDPEKHLSVTKLKEQIFQDNLEYMIGCELRNFSQHASIIARTIHQGTTRNLETGYLTTNLSASISKKELSKDVKRHKLDRMPEAIDLQSCLDGYVDGISQMHVLNLQLLQETIDSLILEVHKFANLARVKAELNTEYSYRVEIKPTFENDNPQGQSSNLQLSISSTWLDLINILRDKQRFRTNFLHTKYEPCQSSLPL
ncbi:hypothetical protein CWE15_11715 [Aliidiomarina taiwanensis]|uniref:Uncharacterized protein n=1 Tax=Aliidiomarina taiwanensis TaxID=946228 RepID=A0A432WTH0_9GAMM|nr:hypothetical protein [Aliidiomarina taiwanensis]RUO37069.1 hypothetical protein CWE15_11715 [Aliidiomarina taiwanensis]